MQINATLVKGKARVQFGANKVRAGSFDPPASSRRACIGISCFWMTSSPVFQNQYNLARAQQSYKSLVQIHEKNGECVAVKLWLSLGSFGSEASLVSSQVGTHHPKRMDRKLHHYALRTCLWVKVSCFFGVFTPSPNHPGMHHLLCGHHHFSVADLTSISLPCSRRDFALV